jgi:hypothetical protein
MAGHVQTQRYPPWLSIGQQNLWVIESTRSTTGQVLIAIERLSDSGHGKWDFTQQ